MFICPKCSATNFQSGPCELCGYGGPEKHTYQTTCSPWMSADLDLTPTGGCKHDTAKRLFLVHEGPIVQYTPTGYLVCQDCNALVSVYDPQVDAEEASAELGVELVEEPGASYDAVILAVGHDEFAALGAEQIRGLCSAQGVLYDATYLLPLNAVDGRL